MDAANPIEPLRVLIVEDSDDDAHLCVRELRREGFAPDFERVDRPCAFRDAISGASWDVVLCDYTMPLFTGGEALEILRGEGFDTPFIFVSGTIGEEYAVAAMRNGAQDYVTKQNLRRLGHAVRRARHEIDQRRARVALESQLRQAQKMEVVGQLAGGVAHDFNNMLAAIIGSLEILEEVRGRQPVEGEIVSDALRAARQAAELVTRLMAFSRRQPLNPVICDLGMRAREALPLLERTIGDHIRIEVRSGDGLWPCLVDPPQVDAAISNLVINARDAMPEGGLLAISAENVSLSEAEVSDFEVAAGDYVRLSVADTGHGMGPEALQKVFEPFFTTKEPGKGTGLGLSMVYGFARQSGGFARIESAPNRGTTVSLFFPRAAGEGGLLPGDEAPDEANAGRSARILVVEDEATVLRTALRMLAALGHDAVGVEDGRQALEALRADDSFELLFTDLNMPRGVSGADLAAEALTFRPDLKVLFTSGNPEFGPEAQREAVERIGQLLVKPWTRRELSEAIDAALDGVESAGRVN